MEYNKNDINRLLSRWENGETSLNEEAELRRLLGKDMCDENADRSAVDEIAAKAMFEYFNSAAAKEDLLEIELPEQIATVTPLIKRNKRITHWLYYTSIAATLVLATTVSFSLFKNNKQQEEFYCVINGSRLNDKDLAQEQLQSAMSVLNAGFALIETEKNNAQIMEIDKLLDLIEPTNDK